ncbi:Cation proton exchanger [Corchorus olitorius]|uniref:Cation proton exchanger n=1 Tax=Corchorus olitorius TaxID=93759 RepID=A0A1R3JHN6_9ROSI|nr:Cation proton exchanger [Corchorus olitorius]
MGSIHGRPAKDLESSSLVASIISPMASFHSFIILPIVSIFLSCGISVLVKTLPFLHFQICQQTFEKSIGQDLPLNLTFLQSTRLKEIHSCKLMLEQFQNLASIMRVFQIAAAFLQSRST